MNDDANGLNEQEGFLNGQDHETHDAHDAVEEVEHAEAAPPGWVTEGTEDDDAVLDEGGEDISAAQPMDQSDVIPPQKNVVMVITKATPEFYYPKAENGGLVDPATGQIAWKEAKLNLYLQIDKTDASGKPQAFAGKMFFPRLTVNVNRKVYDFSHNSQGKPTTWYTPKTGGAFGEYNEVLTALGYDSKSTPKNDEKFRKGLVGKKIVVQDILKKNRTEYDRDSGKRVRLKDEFENVLAGYRPLKGKATGASGAGSAAGTGATSGSPVGTTVVAEVAEATE